LPIGLFNTLESTLPLEPEVVFAVLVGVVVLLVIGETAGLVVVLVTGFTGAFTVGLVVLVTGLTVLVTGLTAEVVVFAVTGLEPVDFTAGDAGRTEVAVFVAGALTVLVTAGIVDFDALVMGATGRVVLAGAKVDSTALLIGLFRPNPRSTRCGVNTWRGALRITELIVRTGVLVSIGLRTVLAIF
jgi:hypothetical protein